MLRNSRTKRLKPLFFFLVWLLSIPSLCQFPMSFQIANLWSRQTIFRKDKLPLNTHYFYTHYFYTHIWISYMQASLSNNLCSEIVESKRLKPLFFFLVWLLSIPSWCLFPMSFQIANLWSYLERINSRWTLTITLTSGSRTCKQVCRITCAQK